MEDFKDINMTDNLLKSLKNSINVYINIANYIESHCKTSRVTDTINTFLANNNSALGGNLPYFLLIILNFVGILYVTIMSLIKPSNKKSLQNLHILSSLCFPPSIFHNCFSFFIYIN